MKNTNNIMAYIRNMAESYLNRGIFRFTVNGCAFSLEWVAPRQYAVMCESRTGDTFNAGYIFA